MAAARALDRLTPRRRRHRTAGRTGDDPILGARRGAVGEKSHSPGPAAKVMSPRASRSPPPMLRGSMKGRSDLG
jgi:hypothetical protein